MIIFYKYTLLYMSWVLYVLLYRSIVVWIVINNKENCRHLPVQILGFFLIFNATVIQRLAVERTTRQKSKKNLEFLAKQKVIDTEFFFGLETQNVRHYCTVIIYDWLSLLSCVCSLLVCIQLYSDTVLILILHSCKVLSIYFL